MVSAELTATETQAEAAAGVAAERWRSSSLVLGLAGSLLLWAALPPLDWWPLGWVATIPWLLLIQRKRLPAGIPTQVLSAWPRPGSGRLQRLLFSPISIARRPYGALWIAGLVFWLLAVHWLRLPHWATYFGWLALAFYLSFYVPVFVGLTRVAVHRVRVPLVFAAPIVWTGLELARAHLLTGFLMGTLGHSQYRWIALIQISDLAGAYAVSFVVMMVSACLVQMWPGEGRRLRVWPLLPTALVVALALVYGHKRLGEATRRPGPRVALIQGAIAADWKQDPDKNQRIVNEYYQLSMRAKDEADGPLDLIVWPETMYRNPLHVFADDFQAPPGSVVQPEELARRTPAAIADLVDRLDAPLIVGLDTWEYLPGKVQGYNSAVGTDRDGRILGRYDKMHLVMFGEYVPLAKYFPWLYRLTPMGGGNEPGAGPISLRIGEVNYAPNICFETVLPHLIRSHILALRSQDAEPDVLVNVTNDAWFHGSSELAMHLACTVFRAVECRKPFLVAANEGISASIDADGRILAQSPKQQPDVILADVLLDDRQSLYMDIGDLPAGLCLLFAVAMAVVGFWNRRRA